MQIRKRAKRLKCVDLFEIRFMQKISKENIKETDRKLKLNGDE